ncbi:MAG: dienelactone hydrolase family protein [Phycisphaerales bacterium]|nr:dienelactone hydrolase family protein [Phycisphaerales bacterium]
MRAIYFCLAIAFAVVVHAEIKTQAIEYKAGEVTLKGVLVYDDAQSSRRPGIVIYPEWWGLTEYPIHRARMLAKLGYVAFAADMYGQGKTTDDPQQAGQWIGQLKQNRAMLLERARAAVETLVAQPQVDPARIGAIGYCAGGSVALELMRAGANLSAVVTFHAGLAPIEPDQTETIKAAILVCNGGDDAYASAAEIETFKQEMRQHKANWQINTYGGAHHSFTNPDADRHKMDNVAYNAEADYRSWRDMKDFFQRQFHVEHSEIK